MKNPLNAYNLLVFGADFNHPKIPIDIMGYLTQNNGVCTKLSIQLFILKSKNDYAITADGITHILEYLVTKKKIVRRGKSFEVSNLKRFLAGY
ncbi:MAG: hypothetical protein KAH77_11570, partial [Thiomargarita sp.]|nr:hypothetical protein [Thiomargarita sp.]